MRLGQDSHYIFFVCLQTKQLYLFVFELTNAFRTRKLCIYYAFEFTNALMRLGQENHDIYCCFELTNAFRQRKQYIYCVFELTNTFRPRKPCFLLCV